MGRVQMFRVGGIVCWTLAALFAACSKTPYRWVSLEEDIAIRELQSRFCISRNELGGCVRLGVPIDTLLANPSAFYFKRVEVSGFVSVGFEDNAIYPSREAATPRRGVWLDLLEEYAAPRGCAVFGPATVRGRYNPDRRGHMNAYGGELEQARILVAPPDTTCER
jgi:hypothetical protein